MLLRSAQHRSISQEEDAEGLKPKKRLRRAQQAVDGDEAGEPGKTCPSLPHSCLLTRLLPCLC